MRGIGIDTEVTPTAKLLWGIGGFVFLFVIWYLLTMGETPLVNAFFLPSPVKVFSSYDELISQNNLLQNTGISIALNLAGYMEAILVCIPLGFLIGLFSKIRLPFENPIWATRYLPLTALTGLFLAWFGIGSAMKIHFLAFGILIYLLPVMVQRIDEVDDVYLKTVHTLGASKWQIFKTVYFPSVLSRMSDDIRVLTAISWTYIIVAETFASQGGVGDLIWKVGQRFGRTDKVFAILIVIVIIGICQDRFFKALDKDLFPHKYQAKESIKSSKVQQLSFMRAVSSFAINVISWIALGSYSVALLQEYLGLFGDSKPLTAIFGHMVWVINIIFFGFIGFRVWKMIKDKQEVAMFSSFTKKERAA